MGWLITLGILVLIWLIPVGLSIRYTQEKFHVRLRVAGISFPFPKIKEETEVQHPQEKQVQPKADTAPAEKQAPKPRKRRFGFFHKRNLGWEDYKPFVRLGLDFLGDLRRKLQIDRLDFRLVLAGEDPCDVAVNYGRAWAAVGSLLPQLERLLVIKKRDVQVECDFTAEKTKISGRVDLHLTAGRALCLAVGYGLLLQKELTNLKKRKGGASL